MLSGISRLLDVYIKIRSVTMKGNINMNWYGTAALCACNQYTSTSTPSNTREPIMIGTGFHLPNNVIAMAIQPLPLTIVSLTSFPP